MKEVNVKKELKKLANKLGASSAKITYCDDDGEIIDSFEYEEEEER